MCYLLLLQQDMSLQPFGSSTWNRKFNPFLSFSQVSQFWSFSCTARSRKTNKKNQNNAVVLFNCPMIIEILLWPWLKKSKSKSQSVNNCIKPVQFLYTVWGIRLCTCYILPRSNESCHCELKWEISDYQGCGGGGQGRNDADVGISYTCSICRRVHGWAWWSRCSSQYERQQGAAAASGCIQSVMTFVPLRPGWTCTQAGSP